MNATMNDWLMLMISFVTGLLVGVLYFGGLWLTVQHLIHVRRPALLALGSLVLRMALLLGGLYFVTDGQWARLGTFLLGFFIIRAVLLRTLGKVDIPQQEKGM